MANPNIPTNLRVLQYYADHVTLGWDFPSVLLNHHSFKVYTDLNALGAFLTLSLTSPRLATDLQNPYGIANFYAVVSSFDKTTGEESAKSTAVFISLDHATDGVGGAVAKSTSGVPKYLSTNERGQLELSGGSIEVTTSSGTAFNEFWFTPSALAPDTPTDVTSLANAGPTKNYVTGLYITGQGRCIAELKRAGVVVWRGRTNDVDTDVNPMFPDGPIEADVGQTLSIAITNDNSVPLDFSGNVFGFKK